MASNRAVREILSVTQSLTSSQNIKRGPSPQFKISIEYFYFLSEEKLEEANVLRRILVSSMLDCSYSISFAEQPVEGIELKKTCSADNFAVNVNINASGVKHSQTGNLVQSKLKRRKFPLTCAI